jgi:ectoine hydroxylase-related dioxygenase (phytanoyl-CoA dioxygenase family)
MKYNQFYETGYQVFENILDENQINVYKKKLLDVYNHQVKEFGIQNLRSIQEENLVRSPFLYDNQFNDMFFSSFAKNIVKDILGDYAILSLQNGIIIPPKQKHHQSFYHRDIIYQDFTSSKPIGVNLYYCLDDYSKENGGTTFLPRSHKSDKLDLNILEETPKVKKGSVILFDSMVYHRAGTNSSKNIRFGVNNMFTLPFIKQQINYSHILEGSVQDENMKKLLGFTSREYLSVEDFRQYRLKRNNKNVK